MLACSIPADGLFLALKHRHPDVHLLGDAYAPRRVVFATRQAWALAAVIDRSDTVTPVSTGVRSLTACQRLATMPCGATNGMTWPTSWSWAAGRPVEPPRPPSVQPVQFDPSSPTLGLTTSAFELLEAFYDHGAEAVAAVADAGAFELTAVDYPDYWADLPENAAPQGRTVQPRFPDDWQRNIDPTGGQLLTDGLIHRAQMPRAESRLDHRRPHVVRSSIMTAAGIRTMIPLELDPRRNQILEPLRASFDRLTGPHCRWCRRSRLPAPPKPEG